MKNDDDDNYTCDYCGCDMLWEDEMKNDEQCKQCFIEECRHPSDKIWREYSGSTHDRVRFTEHCAQCECFREIMFYFDFDMDSRRTAWQHEEVNMEAIQ